ncbi:hypothetical protein, partial [Bradyrhizobium sp. BRP56]|uniref:hypothetical protein n=1 Tax=Bradyrhizobium sp. BRP56 TaxID=2793819 RepID=UPI00201C1BED
AGRLEAPLGEGAAGRGLQISFKSDGLLLVAESDVGLEPPRSKFGCMGHFPGIVLSQSGPQIVGNPDIEVQAIKALENVNVFHLFPPTHG